MKCQKDSAVKKFESALVRPQGAHSTLREILSLETTTVPLAPVSLRSRVISSRIAKEDSDWKRPGKLDSRFRGNDERGERE